MDQNIKVAAAPLQALQYAVIMPSSVLSLRGQQLIWGRRAQIILGGMAMASCAQAKEESRPSLLPALSNMASVIACIDAAPRDAKAALAACADQAGIPIEKDVQEPKSLADFKQHVVLVWLMLDRDPDRPLTPETLTKAIDYARCIESVAYADKAFSSRRSKGVEEARFRAELACKDHPLSIRGLRPIDAASSPDLTERLFAKAVANLTFTYALEANGWFPNEMRPCIRYLDGRPPSAGCAGKPEPRAPTPPM